MTTATQLEPGRSRSVFTGLDVCRQAGFELPAGARRVIFDDDRWDFTAVAGLPIQMGQTVRRLDFTTINNPRWRLVAKEQAMAMLAPHHEAVAQLPRGYRTPLHLLSVSGRIAELSRFFNWLTETGIDGLDELDSHLCQRYLQHRRYLLDEDNVIVGQRSPGTRRAAAQAVVDLLNHRDLFTSDRVPADLHPWGGATPSAVAEMRSGREQNKTPPLDASVLQPMLAAAGYLTSTLAPHAIELADLLRDTKPSSRARPHPIDADLAALGPLPRITLVLQRHVESGQPLPQLPDHHVERRLAHGWDPHDPLLRLNWDQIARHAGYWKMSDHWSAPLRHAGEDAAAAVGIAKSWARDAALVSKASDDEPVPWTVPLTRVEAEALIGIVRTAAITLLAAVSGMRAGELMELRIGACRPPEHYGDDLVRYRLASKIVKGQPLGGTADEWVVIEPAYRAAGLLEALHDTPGETGAPLLGRFAFDVRYRWFRTWVNGPAGQRLGLAPIPEIPVTLRALRRTLAIELAYRPGGVLAAKLHLKHIAVATTEGYASRPGGAQAELLAEVNKHEAERNLELLWTEFRNYQAGTLPAGPGAKELTQFFAHIDGAVNDEAGAPKVQRNDREVLNLMTKRSQTLYLQPGNYCWFTDPSRALCLKLAGTPNAAKPLAGMCDSARCPQATHHACHRDVWAEHTTQTETFLGALGPSRKTERTRLQGDLERARGVLANIDAANPIAQEQE